MEGPYPAHPLSPLKRGPKLPQPAGSRPEPIAAAATCLNAW
jgi:hypothetical protein